MSSEKGTIYQWHCSNCGHSWESISPYETECPYDPERGRRGDPHSIHCEGMIEGDPNAKRRYFVRVSSIVNTRVYASNVEEAIQIALSKDKVKKQLIENANPMYWAEDKEESL
jgi:hypothetical protein